MSGMTNSGRLELVALDAADIDGLAAFYAELLGARITRQVDGWTTIRLPDAQEIAFQEAPDHVPPSWPGQDRPQQFHLDLVVNGHEAAAARAVELGATRLADGASWITLADPAGHPFDLCQRDDAGPGVGLFAVTLDAPDASALAHFYADLLGMAVTYEGPEGAMTAGSGKSLMFQQVDGYHAPSWRSPARPQQAHLDILVDDLDAASDRAVELGATVLDPSRDGFRVFADSAGHPFCLTT